MQSIIIKAKTFVSLEIFLSADSSESSGYK